MSDPSPVTRLRALLRRNNRGTFKPGCGYCAGLRTMCTCQRDCGARIGLRPITNYGSGGHICGKAPAGTPRPMSICPVCDRPLAGYSLINGDFSGSHADGGKCTWSDTWPKTRMVSLDD